jgi:hypothetical protein
MTKFAPNVRLTATDKCAADSNWHTQLFEPRVFQTDFLNKCVSNMLGINVPLHTIV